MNIRWTRSEGGPLLLLEQSLLSSWSGAQPPASSRMVSAHSRSSDTEAATDYDRACDRIYDEISVLQVGSGFGLVFGDEPVTSGWVQGLAGVEPAVVRRVSAWSDDDIIRVLSNPVSETHPHRGLIFEVADSPLVLIDSGRPGHAVDYRDPTFDLPVGCYRVTTSYVGDGGDTSLVLHRFIRLC